MSASLAILYEHPLWFEPLFAALDRRSIAYDKIRLSDHSFDPRSRSIPAPVILSRVAMSAFLREGDHGIFYARSLLAQWKADGALVLNGPELLDIDTSKARQLSVIERLGLSAPATRIVHRPADVLEASAQLRFPIVVKANIGGSGANIVRYSSREEIERSIASGTIPDSIDKVLLVQEYVPPRGGSILRMETLGGRFLYALEVESGGDSFDLCPADACIAAPGRAAIGMKAVTPEPALIAASERIAQAVGMDVGGVEVLIDDRDGMPLFYDINGLSNFVADPLRVLGWDPHERLVDLIEQAIEEKAGK